MTLLDRPTDQSSDQRTDRVRNEHDLEREADRWSAEHEGRERAINVGRTERQICALAGAVLAVFGLRQRSVGGVMLTGLGAGLVYRGATGHCPMYEMLDIDTSDQSRVREGPPRPEEFFERGIHVEQVMTINRSPEQLYAFWRNFTNLPQIMSNVKSVSCEDGVRSHWVVQGPLGHEVEWDAEIINDEPNKTIAWRTLGGACIDHAGSVRFVPGPGDRGTEVKVVLQYLAPMGQIGATLAKLFGKDPESEVGEDLGRFKQIMESSETAATV